MRLAQALYIDQQTDEEGEENQEGDDGENFYSHYRIHGVFYEFQHGYCFSAVFVSSAIAMSVPNLWR